MKKIITLSVAVAAVIIFGSSMYSSGTISPSTTTDKAVIHYQVNIHPNHALVVSSCPALVAITDGSGKIIGMPQTYNSFKKTYHFYETGPVKGTRTAILTNETSSYTSNVCVLVNLKDSKSGMFSNGITYNFDLWASAKDIVSQDVSTAKE